VTQAVADTRARSTVSHQNRSPRDCRSLICLQGGPRHSGYRGAYPRPRGLSTRNNGPQQPTKGDRYGTAKGDRYGTAKGDRYGTAKGDRYGTAKGDRYAVKRNAESVPATVRDAHRARTSLAAEPDSMMLGGGPCPSMVDRGQQCSTRPTLEYRDDRAYPTGSARGGTHWVPSGLFRFTHLSKICRHARTCHASNTGSAGRDWPSPVRIPNRSSLHELDAEEDDTRGGDPERRRDGEGDDYNARRGDAGVLCQTDETVRYMAQRPPTGALTSRALRRPALGYGQS